MTSGSASSATTVADLAGLFGAGSPQGAPVILAATDTTTKRFTH